MHEKTSNWINETVEVSHSIKVSILFFFKFNSMISSFRWFFHNFCTQSTDQIQMNLLLFSKFLHFQRSHHRHHHFCEFLNTKRFPPCHMYLFILFINWIGCICCSNAMTRIQLTNRESDSFTKQTNKFNSKLKTSWCKIFEKNRKTQSCEHFQRKQNVKTIEYRSPSNLFVSSLLFSASIFLCKNARRCFVPW